MVSAVSPLQASQSGRKRQYLPYKSEETCKLALGSSSPFCARSRAFCTSSWDVCAQPEREKERESEARAVTKAREAARRLMGARMPQHERLGDERQFPSYRP